MQKMYSQIFSHYLSDNAENVFSNIMFSHYLSDHAENLFSNL